MAPRYTVTLSRDERDELEEISSKGKKAARTVLYARALLLVDQGDDGPGWVVAKVAQAVGVTPRSIEHLKKRFVEEGLHSSLHRKKREKPPREIIFGGDFEARLLALACTEAPEGYSRWTVRLLAEKMVELKFVPSVSPMTVCNKLKKMNFSLTSASTGKSRRTKARVS